MGHIKIKDNVYWVGVLDPDMRVFDITFKADKGTTYNSYLIKDEKTVLIDTVKGPFTDEFISNIKELTDPEDIDYIVVSHTEPDHTGALQQLLKLAGNVKIIGSKSSGHLLKNVINVPFDFVSIDECPSLNIGTCELEFMSAPYLHWPDTMFTYLEKGGVLFTCDAFGSHFCDERLFNDLVSDFEYYFQYYYDCIMRPFKPYALKAIDKIKDLKIDVIATGHGPILRKDVKKYIESWSDWSRPDVQDNKSVLILYASVYGSTKKMAEAIAEGVSEDGADVNLYDIKNTCFQIIRDALEISDGIIVGSPTIAGDVPRPVWDVLSLITSVKSKIKLGSAFGSYGWSGEAVRMIEDRLSGLRVKLHKPSLKIKTTPDDKVIKECREFGKNFVDALG